MRPSHVCKASYAGQDLQQSTSMLSQILNSYQVGSAVGEDHPLKHHPGWRFCWSCSRLSSLRFYLQRAFQVRSNIIFQEFLQIPSPGRLRSMFTDCLAFSGLLSGLGSAQRNPPPTVPSQRGRSPTSRSLLGTPMLRLSPCATCPGADCSPACLCTPSSLPTLPMAGPPIC